MDKVLVVDDDAVVAELIALMFEEEGVHALIAGDGLEALTIAHEERPQLVLTDVTMPGMDGVELCRQLRRDPGTSAMVVLLMSAAVDTDPSGCGADGVIRKPFDIEDLVETVHRHLTVA